MSPETGRRPAAVVGGVLLAAGTSSRMGRNKLLLRIDGESVLHGAARRALEGGLSPLVVVLGHESEKARAELGDLDVRIVMNPGYETGISSSVRAGVAALDSPDPVESPGAFVDAAVVLLADMPYVTSAMIAALVARYRAARAPLVISDYAGVTAPPMLYDRSLFEELRNMTDGRCGQQVVKRHRGAAAVLAWPAAALADLDLPEDVARFAADRISTS